MGTLKIYPNPAVSDYFIFESNAQIKSVHVFDIIGNEVLEEVYVPPLKATEVYIGSRSTGVYLIKAIFKDNSSTIQKILIK